MAVAERVKYFWEYFDTNDGGNLAGEFVDCLLNPAGAITPGIAKQVWDAMTTPVVVDGGFEECCRAIAGEFIASEDDQDLAERWGKLGYKG
jgi:hypothetical protein